MFLRTVFGPFIVLVLMPIWYLMGKIDTWRILVANKIAKAKKTN